MFSKYEWIYLFPPLVPPPPKKKKRIMNSLVGRDEVTRRPEVAREPPLEQPWSKHLHL